MRTRFRGRRLSAVAVGVLCAALSLAGCSGDRHIEPRTPTQVERAFPDETQQELESAVDFAMTASGASAALVGVWAPWSGQWVAGRGVSDPENGAAADPGMTFRAATIGRAMTCDVLYALAAERTVALTDPVSQYVPGMAGLGDITLGQLCDGTSGLGAYRPFVEKMWTATPSRVWDPRELIAYGLGHRSSAAPGTAWTDSDAGYQLLGLALQQASGKTAAELYDAYVARPLGLKGTTLPAPPARAPGSDPLRGHVTTPSADGACHGSVDLTRLSSSVGFTDSGVVSTLADVKTYVQALATGALLPAGIDRFDTVHAPRPDAPTWFTTGGGAYRAGDLVGQYGSVPGYLTAAFADPRTGLTVVVVLNDSAAPAALAAFLAWQLAAIASTAPAAPGLQQVVAGLPWTAQQYHDAIAHAAICPLE